MFINQHPGLKVMKGAKHDTLKGWTMSKNVKTEDVFSPAIDFMKTMQDAGFNAKPGFGTAWFEAISNMGTEMLDFVAERVKNDVQTQHNLLHAKDISEVQHIQAQFFQKAMDDYAAEMAKLMDMGKDIAPNSPPSDK